MKKPALGAGGAAERGILMRQYVVYLRVSTSEKKKSALSLEAQRRDIDIFLSRSSETPYEVIGCFQDTGSVADNRRPEFGKALTMVRKSGAELLVAKLDRLSRKVSFIAGLVDDNRIRLRVASMPHANNFQLHVYATLAEQERKFNSLRTKAVLQAARNGGVELDPYRALALEALNAAKQEAAELHAQRLIGFVGPLRDQGATLKEIADKLAEAGLATAAGGQWSPMAVSRILRRMDVAA
jgi:DNA invertase Pin-like site-specific DNA recombinase